MDRCNAFRLSSPTECWIESRMGAAGGQRKTNICWTWSIGCGTCQICWYEYPWPRHKYLQDGWSCIVQWQSKKSELLSGGVTLDFQLPQQPCSMQWAQWIQVCNLSCRCKVQYPEPRTEIVRDDRAFGIGCCVDHRLLPKSNLLAPLSAGVRQDWWGERLIFHGSDQSDTGMIPHSEPFIRAYAIISPVQQWTSLDWNRPV